jgi:hypothetical protein
MFATLTQAAAAVECNEHGAVVTLTDGTVFYLGSNCDAERKGGGSGYWFNAGSFLAVNIDGNSYRVIEEVDCLPFCESPL